jgi:hypothetical protein
MKQLHGRECANEARDKRAENKVRHKENLGFATNRVLLPNHVRTHNDLHNAC